MNCPGCGHPSHELEANSTSLKRCINNSCRVETFFALAANG